MALVPIHGRDHCPGGPDEIPCLNVSAIDWFFAFASSPVARAASASPSAAEFSNYFLDGSGLYLDVWTNDTPLIKGPGVYVVYGAIAFGQGGSATRNAYWTGYQLLFDIAALGGTPVAKWRWLSHYAGGSGEGAGYGPSLTVFRGDKFNTPPTDGTVLAPSISMWGIATTSAEPGGSMLSLLAVDQVPTAGVPLKMMVGGGNDESGDAVTDSYQWQIAVARLGNVVGANVSAYL